MCKKRKIITITVLFVLGVAVSYLQWGREIDVVGSMGTSSENFHEEHVTFTLNRLIITDKEKCAEEIIKKCRENDFASTLFSYDVAKPNALYGTVYRSRFSMKGQKPLFATVYKGNIIKNLIMDCQSYTKYRPNETTGGIFVSWRRKEELPTGA